MKVRHKISPFILVWCLIIQLLASQAFAREVLLLAGAEGGGGGGTSNYYTFVGAVAPLFQQHLGDGLVQKYWGDFFGYNYPANGQDITATAVGAEGAIGYQTGGEKWWGGAYAGLRYTNTWLSPDNPHSRVRGSMFRPSLQLEVERNIASDWKSNAIGRYVFLSDAYWTRGRIGYRVSRDVYTGPELVVHGDPDYRAWQGGWVVTFSPFANCGLGIKAGVRKVEKADEGIYTGVEFSRLF